jgi:peptide/nickel transport system substrate-binding protein
MGFGHMAGRTRRATASKLSLLVIPAVLMSVAACGSGGGASGGGGSGGGTSSAGATHASAPGTPQHGGALTVLVASDGWPSGLDPATNTTGGANLEPQQAIFGGLFLLEANDDGSNAHIVPNQAESYTFSNGGKTLTIKIRPGIKFSDGTAFDANAVAWNLKRDLKSSCTCAPQWPLTKTNAITVTDPLTVELHFTRPDPVVINGFPVVNANWIASPTALKKIGETKFKVAPVGAGPFTVVSDKLSAELVLKRNPTYFKKGLPYLDRLTLKPTQDDQAAYQAMLAGDAGAFVGMTTPPVIEQAKKSGKLSVSSAPPVTPYVIQINTRKAPFNNIKAREALFYATDWAAIDKGVFHNAYPVSQSFTAQGGLFYHKQVPGYRQYDLAKAKQLVSQVGDMNITLSTFNIYSAEQIDAALQTQWEKAGMHVTIHHYSLTKVINLFNAGTWQTLLQSAGEWDPGVGIGVAFRFNSKSPFSGVHDPHLDSLLAGAGGTLDASARDSYYQQAAKYISDKAYALFGIVFAPANVAASGVHGPGLTTKIPALAINTQVLFGQVWKQG